MSHAEEVRAAARTLDILHLLAGTGTPVSLAMVVEATGLPKTSAFRYLTTLERRGFVGRARTGGYVVSRPSSPARSYDLEEIAARAQPGLTRLRDRLGETVSLGVLDGSRVLYLMTVKSRSPARVDVMHGTREMVHCTALGKALAARLPEATVRRVLAAEGMPRFTDATITEPASYIAELARVRRAGYAVNNGESDRDSRCVAFALATDEPALAVTLSAPVARLPLSRVYETVAAFREFDAGRSDAGRHSTIWAAST